ncbi:MAG: riboflavin synthase [Candidatus Thioglobus sp.]|nr:riboflavin synthase [Candidatus Thioglobus sp.]
MFTGIIQTIGKIKSIQGAEFCFCVNANNFLAEVKIGDSIAVCGVCLSVTEVNSNCFKADVSLETLKCSILGDLQAGSRVNLEKSLRLNQGVDGHLVSGHVDGVAEIIEVLESGNSTIFRISVSENLVKYIAKKGSISVDGVSLTVNNIENKTGIFSVNIVPQTLLSTTFSDLKVGAKVNLEVDIIARYLEQLSKI